MFIRASSLCRQSLLFASPVNRLGEDWNAATALTMLLLYLLLLLKLPLLKFTFQLLFWLFSLLLQYRLAVIACTILFLTRSLTLGKGPVTRPFFNKDVPVIIVVTVQQVCCSNTLLLQLLICFEISFKDSAKCGICLLLIMRVWGLRFDHSFKVSMQVFTVRICK